MSSYFFDGVFGITLEMAALTAAFYVVLFQEGKSARFHNFKDLDSSDDFISSTATIYPMHLARELFTNCYSDELDILVNYLASKSITLETKKIVECKCQVTIFNSETRDILSRCPKTFDDTCRQLNILAYMRETKVVITAIITNILKYLSFKDFGIFCLYCEKYFSGKGSEHKCKLRRSCFACHRPLLQPTTYTNLITAPLFCSSEIEPKERQICEKCNVTTYNASCADLHLKSVCRWGWFCLKCNQYTFRSKYLTSVDAIKETHICFWLICTFCGERIEKKQKSTHLCPIFNLKPPDLFTKLAFLQVNLNGSNGAWCSDCNNKKLCSFCSDNQINERPNIAVLLLEEKLGHFDSYTFADKNLFDYVGFEKNILI